MLRALLLGSFALGLALPAQAGEAPTLEDLERRMQQLMQEMQTLKQQQSQQQQVIEAQQQQMVTQQQATVAPANVVTGGDFPGSFKLPGTDTSIKIGGYVKTDFIYDFDQRGGPTQGVPRADDGVTNLDTGHFQAHVRQTRLNFDFRTPTDWGVARVFVEGDLFGSAGTESFTNSHNPRLRHAYGTLGPVLTGQTWTNFNSVAAYPETIDFEGPTGEVFLRQPTLRYTQALGDNFTFEGSIENPETIVSGAAADAGFESNRDRFPDFIVKGTFKDSWGFLSLSGVARQLNVANGVTDDTAFGWGLGLGGRINTVGKDNIRFEFNGGDGIGRYMLESGKTGVFVDAAGNIDTVTAVGGFAGYQHWWTDTVRSNLIYGRIEQDNPSVAPATTTETIQSVHANLIWSPTPKTNFGLEYSAFLAERESGDDSIISRIQLGMQYKF